LTPHQQLPAVRQLANDLGVNPNTVQKAYQELERLGYIYSQVGKGSFINEKQNTLQLTRRQKFDELDDLLAQMKQIGIEYSEILGHVSQIFEKGVNVQ
jgi:GntR family transcriptional regulator